jgi:putative ATP-dependent endonuclease of the OLD family
VLVVEGKKQLAMRPRTLEESIAYENFALLRDGSLSIGITIPGDLGEAYGQIYERIGSKDFKKTDFAIDLLAAKSTWTVRAYVAEGLRWLELRLCRPAAKEPPDPTSREGAASPAPAGKVTA